MLQTGGITILEKVGRIKEITDQGFDREVLKSELPVLACFITAWCKCYATCLFVDELAERYDGKVKFFKVDIDKNPEVSGRYHIIAVPTILFFKSSRLVKSLMGFYDRNFLQCVLDNVVAGDNLPNGVYKNECG